ncbi:MAG: hypothetical protein OXC72_13650, partial [Roseovarius sp.]|nr:hypothetical protein [Roseovarius sp.]
MHDIRAIRENPAAFDIAMERRGIRSASKNVLEQDQARRKSILEAEIAQSEQNRASKDAGAAKARGDESEFNLCKESTYPSLLFRCRKLHFNIAYSSSFG